MIIDFNQQKYYRASGMLTVKTGDTTVEKEFMQDSESKCSDAVDTAKALIKTAFELQNFGGVNDVDTMKWIYDNILALHEQEEFSSALIEESEE